MGKKNVVNMAEMLKDKKKLLDNISENIEKNNGKNPVENSDNKTLSFQNEKSSVRREENKMAGMLLGKWHVAEHKIGGEDYIDYFIRTRLQERWFEDAQYEAFYEFKGRISLKTMRVRGRLYVDKDIYDYDYRVKLTSTYEVTQDNKLVVILESGYLYYQIGDQMPVVKDFQADDKPLEIQIELANNDLILKEPLEDDYKKLVRID
jgi:hypothetical protein